MGITLKFDDAASGTTASWHPPDTNSNGGSDSSSDSSSGDSSSDNGDSGNGAAAVAAGKFGSNLAAGKFAGKRLPTATKQPASKRPRYDGGTGGRNGNATCCGVHGICHLCHHPATTSLNSK